MYVEGDEKLREGFHEFLKEVRERAQERRIRFKPILCGAEPVRDFGIALRSNPDAFNVLLLDSDGSVDNALARLKQRTDWKKHVVAVRDDQIHWMVQIMESWFLADFDTLRDFYGTEFAPDHLPRHQNVEDAPKADVEKGLKEATRRTPKRAYHKTAHAPEILKKLNTDNVRKRAPHCDRLFKTLHSLVES